jgi:hypothetical protein
VAASKASSNFFSLNKIFAIYSQQEQKAAVFSKHFFSGALEDRVHELLSSRLGEISYMFGQIPDCLDDVWIKVALNEIEDAKKTIDEIPDKHPFELRYDRIEPVRWEECSTVLDSTQRRRHLMDGW